MINSVLLPLAFQLRRQRNVTLTIHLLEFATFPPVSVPLLVCVWMKSRRAPSWPCHPHPSPQRE